MGYYTWILHRSRTSVKARSIHSHFPSVLTLDTEDCTKAPGLSCGCWTGSTSSSQMQKCLHNNLKQGRKTLKSNPQEEAGLRLPESPPQLCVLVCGLYVLVCGLCVLVCAFAHPIKAFLQLLMCLLLSTEFQISLPLLPLKFFLPF